MTEISSVFVAFCAVICSVNLFVSLGAELQFPRARNWFPRRFKRPFQIANLESNPFIEVVTDAPVERPIISQFTSVPQPEKCLCGIENPPPPEERIVGGLEVKPKNRYPWMALITDKNDQLCGGAIINSRFVVTAAHCLDVCEDSTEGCKVVLGVHNISEGRGVYEVDKLIKHDAYRIFINDIGLLKLKKPIKFSSSVRPICLPEQQESTDIKPYEQQISTAGWGLTDTGKSSDVLMQFNADDWLKHDKSKSRFCKDLLCLKQGNGRFESGDSGGPAWIIEHGRAVIVGVVSHYRLHRMRLTRVPLVKDWIVSQTKSASSCH